jgi:tRNA(fMet)-specific endonuclease VapC
VHFLLDTNVISYLIEERPAIERRLRTMDPASRLYTSAVNEGELLFGIENASPVRRNRLSEDIGIALRDLTVVPVDSPAADAYAKIRHSLTSRGRIIPDNHIWIAAVAMANDYTLVSHDAAFARIPGLKLEDWLA